MSRQPRSPSTPAHKPNRLSAPDSRLREAVALHQAGQFSAAEALYRALLEVEPEQADALHLLGLIEKQKGQLDKAIALIERALAHQPQAAAIHANLGNAYREAGQLARAISCYDKALTLQPAFADCLNNLGIALRDVGRLDDAEQALRRAIAIAPAYADAYNNLGTVLHKAGHEDTAFGCYRQAVECEPQHAVARYNLGNAWVERGALDKAIEEFRAAIASDPQYAEAISSLARQLQATCSWGESELWCTRLREIGCGVGAGKVFPFAYVAIDSTLAEQQACANAWANVQHRALRARRLPPPEPRPSSAAQRLRIGYLSSDLHNHATAYLMAEVFELHDRARFEVFAFSLGADDGKEMRVRLRNAFEHFVDLHRLPLDQVAAHIRAARIDILVDLKGYTKDTGTPVLAMRPAPIQVSHLGYPGTLGADLADYLITDHFVTPPEYAAHFNERFAYVSGCYQPNDRQRPIASRPPRSACGLPEDGVVFCCFNHSYKITPQLFALWCRILAAVPHSVLWLLRSNPWAEANLREAAARHEIQPSRLIFASEMALDQHLARLQHADLFLDTLPYNAHTTASDALWAGVPLITCPGQTFASRVAGSLLHACNLGDLVCASLDDYAALAIRLANKPSELATVKARLAAERERAALFDSQRFTRDIESLFEQMWQRHQTGQAPAMLSASAAPGPSPIAQQSAAATPQLHIVHVSHDQHKPIFDVLIAQIERSASALGIPHSRSDNSLRGDCINLLVGSTIFVADTLAAQLGQYPCVIYQMEQLVDRSGNFRARQNYVDLLARAIAVWDYSATNVAALQRIGLARVRHVPIGYEAGLETVVRAPQRDIDVLFFGSLTARREQVLREIEAGGATVRMSFGEYGSALDALIARAHIVLNCHQFDAVDILEEVRLSYLVANRCCVVSELADHDPYGGGVVFVPYTQLAQTCLDYLARGEAARARQAEQAWRYFSRQDYRASLAPALSAIGLSVNTEPPPRTCLFSLCWLDGADGYGPVTASSPSRLARTLKWLDFYAPLLPMLGAERIVFVDDGSDIKALRSLGGAIFGPDLCLREAASSRPYLYIIRFDEHLPRRSVSDYPYFWRGIGIIPALLQHWALAKLIFIESDCYVLTPRLADFLRKRDSGFTAFWTPRYNCPESALSILCRDQFEHFAAFCNEDTASRYAGQPAELVLPFTHFVHSGFCGDRFGEDALPQALEMDFYAQCPVPVAMRFDLRKALRINVIQVSINEHKAIFEEVIVTMLAACEALGLACSRSENTYIEGALNILIGSVSFVGEALLQALKGKPYAVYQMEQIAADQGHLPRFPAYLEVLREARMVWDYSQTNIKRLAELGISGAIHVPVGYHPKLERIRPSASPDIDVLFYGAPSPRRDAVLQQLAARGAKVSFAFGVYADERDALIARARIVLNVHANEIDTLEEVRLSYLLSNRCFVISERSDHNPYGEGVVFAAYPDLVETCCDWLERDAALREAVASAGYAAIRALDATPRIKTALEALNATLSAAAAPNVTPAPPVPASQAAASAQRPYYHYARPEVAALVAANARQILDIGCGAGMLGHSLKTRQHCHVTGIEIVAEVAEQARKVLDRVLVGDACALADELADHSFDVVLMADVLEHVADTDALLALAHKKLSAQGQLVLSLPNVQHWSVLKGLLEGRWDYQEQGILDRTHLKFFTRRSALAALARNGFVPLQVQATQAKGEAPPAGLGAVLKTFGIEALELEREALCFQYLFVCRKHT